MTEQRVRGRWRWVAAGVSVCLAAGCASTRATGIAALESYPAELQGIVRITYYDVHGRTEKEVAADLRRQARIAVNMPSDGMGLPIAETNSPMRWSWTSSAVSGNLCMITKVRVSMTVDIQLPRWTPPPDADSVAVADWGRFIATIELHEGGHKDIAVAAAREIVERLSSLTSPCSSINDDASRLGQQIAAKAQSAQVEYDLATHHGMLQGPGFPPSPIRPSGGRPPGDVSAPLFHETIDTSGGPTLRFWSKGTSDSVWFRRQMSPCATIPSDAPCHGPY